MLKEKPEIEIKNSREFRLIFDHLLPMKRYMALSAVMATDGLSKFIPEPTIVLEETKETLRMIIENLINSTDFKHVPDPIANFLQNFAMRNEGGTTGKDLDLTKEILKILLRTPLLILKGFVEITDPAIIVAKMIIDITNIIATMSLSAIKTGLKIAKQVIETGIQTAESMKLSIEISLSTSIGAASAVKNTLPTVDGTKLGDYVKIEIGAGDPIETWKAPKFVILPLPSETEALLKKETYEYEQAAWTGFKKQFEEMEELVQDYTKAAEKIEDLKSDLEEINDEFESKVKDAEKILKEVYSSPFLLPGLWAALVPPMTPAGGGIIPPPFPGGPFHSTVPGMIYLALLLIDAIEEKTHDDIQKLGEEPDCASEL